MTSTYDSLLHLQDPLCAVEIHIGHIDFDGLVTRNVWPMIVPQNDLHLWLMQKM